MEVGDWKWCVGKRMAVAALGSVLGSRCFSGDEIQ